MEAARLAGGAGHSFRLRRGPAHDHGFPYARCRYNARRAI